MQRISVLIIAVSALLLQGLAFASDDLMKWSQLPDLQKGARLSQWDPIDYGPQTARASDWVCANGLPVNTISWWGSRLLNKEFELQGFDVKVFENVFSEGYNRPGSEVYDKFIPIEQLSQSSWGVNAVGSETFKYTTELEDPFEQIKGQTYWLSIIAVTPNADAGLLQEWRWQEAIENINNSTRVGLLIDSLTSTNPDVVDCHWGQENERDLAFEMITDGNIPEPASVIMMSGGIVCMLYFFRSRKKN
jgi:hypothetical protein